MTSRTESSSAPDRWTPSSTCEWWPAPSRHFGPGDIALSRLQAGKGAVGAHIGQRITAYLADGTPYRATVTAIYFRSFGFGDVIIPSSAAGARL